MRIRPALRLAPWSALLALGLACGAAAPAAPADGACRLPGAPAVIHQDGAAVELVWEMEDAPWLWRGALPASRAFARFRAGVEAQVPELDPRALLRRTYQGAAAPASEDERRQRHNNRAIAEGRVGRLRPINCLEAALLAYQAERVPMLERPTELHGVILSREADGRTWHRVYFAASDQLFPPKPVHAFERIDRDLAGGWRLVAHLHNHTWHLGEAGPPGANDGAGDTLAVTAPSTPDVHYYRGLRDSRGLARALVTNGFHTVEIEARELDALEARD